MHGDALFTDINELLLTTVAVIGVILEIRKEIRESRDDRDRHRPRHERK